MASSALLLGELLPSLPPYFPGTPFRSTSSASPQPLSCSGPHVYYKRLRNGLSQPPPGLTEGQQGPSQQGAHAGRPSGALLQPTGPVLPADQDVFEAESSQVEGRMRYGLSVTFLKSKKFEFQNTIGSLGVSSGTGGLLCGQWWSPTQHPLGRVRVCIWKRIPLRAPPPPPTFYLRLSLSLLSLSLPSSPPPPLSSLPSPPLSAVCMQQQMALLDAGSHPATLREPDFG